MCLECNSVKVGEILENLQMWLNHRLLNSNGPKKKLKGKLKNILRQKEVEAQHTKTYELQQKQLQEGR
jgi:hypothetical protein